MITSSEFLKELEEREKLIADKEAQKQLQKQQREEKRAQKVGKEKRVQLMAKIVHVNVCYLANVYCNKVLPPFLFFLVVYTPPVV